MAVITCKDMAKIIDSNLKTDWDFVIAITGQTGTGKSTLALQIARHSMKFDLIKNVCYLPDEKEIMDKFFAIERYGSLIIDEAVQSLNKYDWYNKEQQTIIKMYNTERHQNKATFVLIPNINMLTASLRNEKVFIWIHVFTRGHALVYMSDFMDKDCEDPWHIKENSKLKKKKLKLQMGERTVDSMVKLERMLPNYMYDIYFEDLEEPYKTDYRHLKEESRGIIAKRNKEIEGQAGNTPNPYLQLSRLRLRRAIILMQKAMSATQQQIADQLEIPLETIRTLSSITEKESRFLNVESEWLPLSDTVAGENGKERRLGTRTVTHITVDTRPPDFGRVGD